MTDNLHHENLAGGPPVKGVTCKRGCGARVGLVQSKAGRWYTCELVRSRNEDSSALRACPWMPHRCAPRVERVTAEQDAEYLALQAEMHALDPELWEGATPTSFDTLETKEAAQAKLDEYRRSLERMRERIAEKGTVSEQIARRASRV